MDITHSPTNPKEAPVSRDEKGENSRFRRGWRLEEVRGFLERARRFVKEIESEFFWMRQLSVLLAEYEQNRVRYPDFESFFPEIARFFTTYSEGFNP